MLLLVTLAFLYYVGFHAQTTVPGLSGWSLSEYQMALSVGLHALGDAASTARYLRQQARVTLIVQCISIDADARRQFIPRTLLVHSPAILCCFPHRLCELMSTHMTCRRPIFIVKWFVEFMLTCKVCAICWQTVSRYSLFIQQVAQLSPSDCAMRLVSSNLANYHASVQKISLLMRQVLTKPMLWSWRFSWRQCVINKPTTVELCISPVYRRLAVAKFSKSTM